MIIIRLKGIILGSIFVVGALASAWTHEARTLSTERALITRSLSLTADNQALYEKDLAKHRELSWGFRSVVFMMLGTGSLLLALTAPAKLRKRLRIANLGMAVRGSMLVTLGIGVPNAVVAYIFARSHSGGILAGTAVVVIVAVLKWRFNSSAVQNR